MRKTLIVILAAVMLFIQVFQAQSVRPLPQITIEVHEDLSVTLKANVFRVIHAPETLYFSNTLRAPILSWIRYKGNLTANLTQNGLIGVYTMLAIPRPGDPARRASFFPVAASKGQFDNTTVHTMMSFFYGKSYLLLFGLRWEFVNATYAVAPRVNFTGVSSIASVSSRNPKIKYIHMSFDTETQEATKALIVNYNLTVESLPLELKKSPQGYYFLDLTPITVTLPDDIAANLWVNFTDPKIGILGGTPPPKVVLWNSALWEFVPQLQEGGKSLIVIIERTEPSFPASLVMIAAIPPIVVGAYLFWRIKLEGRKKRKEGKSTG